jgi:hypothetical protein
MRARVAVAQYEIAFAGHATEVADARELPKMVLFAVSTLSYTVTRTIGWPFLITIPAVLAASAVAYDQATSKRRTYPLADQGCDNHLSFIEFRPNDLASPRIARLTDDLLPKISN